MAEKPPAWLRNTYQGPKRVLAEMRAFQKHLGTKAGKQARPRLHDLQMPDENDCMTWQLRVSDFDEADTRGGRQLNQDLAQLASATGAPASLLLELSFPPDFPTSPFSVRVVTPRCKMYTGHVTVGGSVCLQALVATGQPGGWEPTWCVEPILALVLQNMVDTETVVVQTSANPAGGVTGPLRVDLQRGTNWALMPYTKAEAQAAHQRALAQHAQTGWGATGGVGAGAAAAAAGAGGAVNALPRVPAPPAHLNVGLNASFTQMQQVQQQIQQQLNLFNAAVAAVAPMGPQPVAAPRPVVPPAGAAPPPLPHVPQGARPIPPILKKVPATAAAAGTGGADSQGLQAGGNNTASNSAAAVPLAGPSNPRKRPLPAAATAGAAGPSFANAVDLTMSDDDQEVKVMQAVAGVRAAAPPAGAKRQRPAPSAPGPQQLGAVVVDLVDSSDEEQEDEEGGDKRATGSIAQLTRKDQVARNKPALLAGTAAGAGKLAGGRQPSRNSGAARGGLRDTAQGAEGPGTLQGRRRAVKKEDSDDDEVVVLRAVMAPPPPPHVLAQQAALAAKEAELAAKESELKKREAGLAAVQDPQRSLLCTAPLPQYWERYTEDENPEAVKFVILPYEGDAEYDKLFGDAEDTDEMREMRREVQVILNRWSGCNQRMSTAMIKRIERIQNWPLLTKYTTCVDTMVTARNLQGRGDPALNERYLFHGSSLTNLEAIIRNGLDIRKAQLHGSLGAGAYLAVHPSYSVGFSRNQAGMIAMPGGVGVGLGGLAAGPIAQWNAGFQKTTQAIKAAAAAAGAGTGGPSGAQGRGRRKGPAKAAPQKKREWVAPDKVKPKWKTSFAMLMCRALLGRVGHAPPGAREPPPGCDSASGSDIFAVYDNGAACPEYLIHFEHQ